LPSEKVDVSGLVAEKSRREHIIRANGATRNRRDQETRVSMEKRGRIEHVRADIERLQRELAQLIDEDQQQTALANELDAMVAALVDPTTADVDAQISAASETNTAIDRAIQYRERGAKLATMEKAHDQLTEQIESFDQAKSDALSRAQFPIPGLCFADGDVSYEGTLFDQLSSAEQVRVSLAMAMAMNPALKVIMIRDGSLLDETSLGIIRDLAKSRSYQIWLEVVGNRSDATVIIEDGAVVGAEESEPETEVVS
jgi:hypothetical protein